LKNLFAVSFSVLQIVVFYFYCGNLIAQSTLIQKQYPVGNVDSIVFGSCALEWIEQPVWDAMLKKQPDLYISLGDAIYGDWDGSNLVPVSVDSLKKKWNTLAMRPEFQRMRSRVPMLAIWDNHDYGTYKGGVEFHLKEQSKELFLNFWREPIASLRRQRTGIYDAKIIGNKGKRVQIILLDTRSFRSKIHEDTRSQETKQRLGIVGKYSRDTNPDTTILGKAQWLWLKKELGKEADLRLIVSGTQIIADEKGMDEWGIFPHERQRLFDAIEETRAHGVVILTGNVHFSEISIQNDFAYPLIEFTASGMTPKNINPEYARAKNNYRLQGPHTKTNFGMLHIDWENVEGPQLLLASYGLNGKIAFSTSINLNELQF
jgi:alkaline phosphatase D